VVTASRISKHLLFWGFLSSRICLKHLVKDLGLAKAAGLDSPLIHPLYDSYAAAEKKDWAIKMHGDY
jgi:hypothetical protein